MGLKLVALVLALFASLSQAQDYAKAINLSNLFYEAQRAGTLPSDQRVTWRKTSFTTDGKDNGVDLSGGYFDAGDFVKFNFPMAYSMTVIAWGLIDFNSGYNKSAEIANTLKTIKWGTDYFIKCHTAASVLWGQVGNGGVDHAYWGRPQDWPTSSSRPSYKIDASNGGSDLAGETAAALAAASMVFQASNPTYAATCLTHAKQLYTFANSVRKAYSDSITDAANYYKSWSGFQDELVWAAAWLYRATGDVTYLTDAENKYVEFGMASQMPGKFDWDDKKAGVFALLCRVSKSPAQYCTKLTTFCTNIVASPTTNSGGMLFLDAWGSCRHAANSAFILFQATQLGKGSYSAVAKKQLTYILGTNPAGISYLVGYGTKYPLKPHHRAGSCPLTGACGFDQLRVTTANPQIVQGALVGGPKQDDTFPDNREDYQTAEVACDYNAGFQGACAAALML